MIRSKGTSQITKAALIIALLICLYLLTFWIRVGESIIQLTDGVYIFLCLALPFEWTMLFVGIIYPTIIDCIGGGFIFIPLSIVIHVLMFLILRIKYVHKIIKIILASTLIFIYLPYIYLVFNSDASVVSLVIKESVVDSIQWVVTIVFALTLTYNNNLKHASAKIFQNSRIKKDRNKLN